MLPLLYPELEKKLSGFVALNSAPSLWLEAAAKCAKENNLPDLTPEMQEFGINPNPETFKLALNACLPYYFPSESLEKGKKLLGDLPFEYRAAVWWLRKAMEIDFNALWIPKNVPMLVLGASHDFMAPFSLYESDNRFKQPNVKMIKINRAGHCPWVEQPLLVKEVFDDFCQLIQSKAKVPIRETVNGN